MNELVDEYGNVNLSIVLPNRQVQDISILHR